MVYNVTGSIIISILKILIEKIEEKNVKNNQQLKFNVTGFRNNGMQCSWKAMEVLTDLVLPDLS